MKRLLFIFGTRPEAIKLAPLIKKFKVHKSEFEVKVCVTSQHKEMLWQVLEFFKINADYNLNIMKHNQTLFQVTSECMKKLEGVLEKFIPDIIFVQGDALSAFLGALAGFYKKIKIAHIEAGLRSYNKYSPFPEEVSRVLISHIADYHFAPTVNAKNNLLKEGIKKNIFVVGNTVIDALFLGLEIIKTEGEKKYYKHFNFIDFEKKVILVTGHRRESFGKPFENICLALKKISQEKDVEIVYPVHLNPNVRKPVFKILGKIKNVHLIEPLSYPYLIWLMNKSYLILTDSGGIQEEAPSLGKPVLVMRKVTERVESIKAGVSKLVGTEKKEIFKWTQKLLTDKKLYKKMSVKNNPYGDGKSSEKIYSLIKKVIV
ncbi:MAG: UDP-N-acetylglucosamine 2-epimerase (non-hydrolyzing) [Endomicrobiia bacterium]